MTNAAQRATVERWLAKARWVGLISVNSKTGATGKRRHIMAMCPSMGVDFYVPTREEEIAFPLCDHCVKMWHAALNEHHIPFGGHP
jgi:hypothetical protein